VTLNDPFGGWVQWNRISPIAVEEVEVLRGGASSLYGGSGLSGAIELRPRTASEDLAFSGEAFTGSQRTASASAFAGKAWNRWEVDVAAGHFQTRGFIPVDENERGAVDSYAGVRSVNATARIGRALAESFSLFFRPTYFGESRTNGTPAQINRTHSRQFVLGGRMQKPPRAQGLNDQLGSGALNFDWRAFGGTQVYDQTFSAVAADRSSESLTRLQRSPSQFFGASGTLNASVRSHTILAGIEGREVRGSSDEIGFSNGVVTSSLGSGGRERTVALFAKDLVTLGDRVIVSGGVRYDRWENSRGLSVTTPFSTGISTVATFADRTEGAWSPSMALQVQATEKFSIRAVASRSFRSPTLNELYRGFRVGNVVTNANADLRAERATNFEAGAAYRFRNSSIRVTGFMTSIERAVANVTLSITPSLITRQRQNAGETRTTGFEANVLTRLGPVDFNVGYLLADSRLTAFPSNPTLVDRFIPQVPRHQVNFHARYPIRSWTLSLQGRAASQQFDDDLNQFSLEPYFQLDAFASRRLGEKLSIFAAIENAFNSRYSTGRTPIRTVSSSISFRAGVRWN
jgi:outer membrane receptor protein involved in Fe transport